MNAVSEVEFVHSPFVKKLPVLLRIVGACALLVAMYSFLVRGWQSGNDVSRYLMLLSHTGLLAAVGLASGHWLKEGKGARLLVTLALVSVPANFAILGAFIFSQTTAIDLAQYPDYVAWTVASLPAALLTTGGALLVLVPVTLLGFTVLARSISRKLSLLFLCSNLALLLSLRDPLWIAILVSSLTLCVVWFSRQAAQNQTAARTGEGIVALGLQLLPLGVLLGRSLWLYAFDFILLTVLAITVFFVLRRVSLYLKPGSAVRNLLDTLSLVPAVSVTLLLGEALRLSGFPVDVWVLPISTLASASLIYEISRRNGGHAGTYRRIAVLILLIGMFGNLALFSNWLAASSCIVMGVLLIVAGYREQQLSLFAGGLLLSLAGVLYQFIDLIRDFDLANWTGLAVMGIVSIVFASVLESQGGKIRRCLATWRGRLQRWET